MKTLYNFFIKQENTAEDTAWLALESQEFLYEAKQWPEMMSTIANIIGVFFMAVGFYGMSTDDTIAVYASGVIVLFIGYKLYHYHNDITLVNNELRRRKREGEL